jgi:hypothetical protein
LIGVVGTIPLVLGAQVTRAVDDAVRTVSHRDHALGAVRQTTL